MKNENKDDLYPFLVWKAEQFNFNLTSEGVFYPYLEGGGGGFNESTFFYVSENNMKK